MKLRENLNTMTFLQCSDLSDTARQEFDCENSTLLSTKKQTIKKLILPPKKILSPPECACKDSSQSQVLPVEHAHHDYHKTRSDGKENKIAQVEIQPRGQRAEPQRKLLLLLCDPYPSYLVLGVQDFMLRDLPNHEMS